MLLRVLMLAVLYLFVLSVVLAIRHDVNREESRSYEQPTLRLLVVAAGKTGLRVGEKLPLADETTIGRAESNSIVLNDTFVSAEHAAIEFSDGGWWIEDRGSTNGTLVNDQPLTDALALADGDVIAIGQIRLRLTG